MKPVRTIEWIADHPDSPVPGHIRMVDQTLLPNELVYLETRELREVWTAIKTLQVRGAPAIGIAAAMGVATAVQDSRAADGRALAVEAGQAADYLATSRPTAVNLFWALDRMRTVAAHESGRDPETLKRLLAREAIRIWEEDIAMSRAIGMHGAALLKDGQTVLTHCNAGGLATAQYGTALAPIYVAQEQAKRIRVYVDETRPLLQGARLTAWELMQAGIETTLICDNMAAQVLKEGKINLVMVGADRIAANGDTANKIGTYGVAVLAHAHGIPFYVLAPSSTFDLTLASGGEIPIEERGADEITRGFGRQTAPVNVKVYSPAFDVTPARLITAIICEKGVLQPPFDQTLKQAVGGGERARDDRESKQH
ncbi:MAG: S-methyl-5-thioribose-1-phosphate isomerase [Verrucomicrobia bacterium]|nr:S-methyl-5-thioribose-1-phosphate isomerase [Verrucomicrobiota bacterium]MCG2680455.1 S-methyl-5-thioribose-1-phosphate isomerase [Kiritimatiellia bacterium]MBU4247546.1 S-methyl-5-thioribose-1-phosphate isomerase [Verrucomicrobiota bacterium]MBU4291266.1 S-methyl-5-thioribose-1-phosphate isomerase [Verrucomicrobiota bacterium]MBU4428982.1 S-methyl-5-thioribose-1-phosphate isomerase [Verrucomicrobiota bacterium]